MLMSSVRSHKLDGDWLAQGGVLRCFTELNPGGDGYEQEGYCVTHETSMLCSWDSNS